MWKIWEGLIGIATFFPGFFFAFYRVISYMLKDLVLLAVHMEKYYDARNREKQIIDQTSRVTYPHPREVRAVKLWLNIWSEENGKSGFMRPVLVMKKIGSLFFVIPMTTKWKQSHRFYYELPNGLFARPSFLMLSQGRVIDTKRFMIYIGKISDLDYYKTKNILRRMYL